MFYVTPFRVDLMLSDGKNNSYAEVQAIVEVKDEG